MLIGVGITVLQCLVGIDTAMYYGPILMKDAGIKINGLSDDESSLLLNIPLAGANFIGTIFAIMYIERMGRRGILLRTTPLLALCWLFTAIGMSFTSNNLSDKW